MQIQTFHNLLGIEFAFKEMILVRLSASDDDGVTMRSGITVENIFNLLSKVSNLIIITR